MPRQQELPTGTVPASSNGFVDSLDFVCMRSRPSMLSIAVALGAGSVGCSSPTSGTPLPTPAPVTVVSTVTVTPPLPTRRRVFVTDAVEEGVVKILRDEYKISNVGEATCPENQTVAPGNTFVCVVTVGGADKSVKVVVKSADGEYEVGQPL